MASGSWTPAATCSAALDERIGKRAGVSLELLVGARLPAQLAQPVEHGNLDTLFFGDFAHGFCSKGDSFTAP